MKLKINTRKFGEITIDKENALTMPEGLPGFPGFEKFVLIEDKKTEPFCWFQSLEEPDLALVIMDPLVFKPDYRVDFKTIIKGMGWKETPEEKLLTYVVINIREKEGKAKEITANLMGPLVINPGTRQVVQVIISDPSYSCHYNIMQSGEEKSAV